MSFLLHKKFTWPDFGRVYIPIYPPVATPLIVDLFLLKVELKRRVADNVEVSWRSLVIITLLSVSFRCLFFLRVLWRVTWKLLFFILLTWSRCHCNAINVLVQRVEHVNMTN